MARLLFLGHDFGNGNENLDGQQSHAVLVVGGEMLEKRDHFVNDDSRWHSAKEFGKVDGGLSPDHWGVIVHEL